jgi:hypothetical protein
MSRCLAPVLVSALILAACGGGDQITTPKTTLSYSGVFAGENGTESGSFSVAVVVEDNSASGTFNVNGTAHSFTSGSYNTPNVTASGSGFIFTGSVTDSAVSGSYESPTGGGVFTGLRNFPGSPSFPSYCGTHIGTNAGVPLAGPFVFVTGNGVRRGVFTSVLSDPFRGLIRSASTATAITLDTLTGNASLTMLANTFTGNYAMASGDTGQMEGHVCPTGVGPSIGSIFDGVLGSFSGTELGSLNLQLRSDGVGSTGSYKIGAVAKPFVAVISGVNNQVAVFDTTYRIIASVDTATVGGRYSSGGAVAGRVAGLHRVGSTPLDAYCGGHSLGGAFSFVLRPDSVLFGLYTGGSLASAFQGDVTGKPGDLGQFETEPGPVTILPDPGSFGGFWDHSATGGTSGTLTGSSCP